MKHLLLVVPLAVLVGLGACSKSEPTKPTETDSGGTGGGGATPSTPAAPPLTQADIDKYVALKIDFYAAPKNLEGQKMVLGKHGMTDETWGALFQRMRDARFALIDVEKRGIAVPAHMVADVELLKANRERVEAAEAGKKLP